MSVQIKTVEDKKQLKAFLQFPFTLYKGNKYWVPPMFAEEKQILSDKNPAMEYCKYKIFLAYKDNKVVGRIVGIINTKSNEIWKEKNVRFGWIDFIDDPEVSQALLNAVAEWGKANGMDTIHGPLGFTDMDMEGMLIEGFDKLPTIANIYNYPYAPQHLEKIGFEKDVDWVQMKINASQPIPEKVARINDMIMQKYELKLLKFAKTKDVLPYATKIFHTLNAAFSNLYGFVPLNEKQIAYYTKMYFPFVNPKLVSVIVDKQDEVVGFGISMPSLSRAYQKAKGRLFPFGFIHLLRALHNYENIDLYLNGVHPDWQNKGVHSIFYGDMNVHTRELKSKVAICNPQLESNTALMVWKHYEHEVYLRRRCYKKKI